MAEPIADEDFAQALQQLGLVDAECIAKARQAQADADRLGLHLTLADALVHQGVIGSQVKENLEKRLRAQHDGGLRQLGQYRLLKKIGEGGVGAVYLAEDVALGRRVALKVLSKKHTHNPAFQERFTREAKAAGQLNHTNIASAFAIGEELGHHYYVMEYWDGETLDALVKRIGRVPEAQVLDIAIQAARGLQFAHQAGFVHRDIKPSNLFLTKEGVVKILDLGLARAIAEAEEGHLTSAGVAVGTPHYISPEQARGERDLDGRADMYSLGATLFHLLVGRTLYEGPSSAVILNKGGKVVSQKMAAPSMLCLGQRAVTK